MEFKPQANLKITNEAIVQHRRAPTDSGSEFGAAQ
jgi:hypothetical protein